jgi:hypothetical protein
MSAFDLWRNTDLDRDDSCDIIGVAGNLPLSPLRRLHDDRPDLHKHVVGKELSTKRR